jgi:hypothetical protein
MMDSVRSTDTGLRTLAKAYYIAKSVVIQEGFAPEIDWQYQVSLDTLDEPTFLCEAAWVILNSGMRESVISSKFPSISKAFFNWQCSRTIVSHANKCRAKALRHFNHAAKIEAIINIATHVDLLGFRKVTELIAENGVAYLQQFPYIGPATSLHLAKNIGLPLAKPDRHLLRIASGLGYEKVQDLCSDISFITGEPVPVVDLVIWRYATRHKHQLFRFTGFFKRHMGLAAS